MSDTLELWTLDVSDRTQWRVVRLVRGGEPAGLGECSGSGPLPAVLTQLSQLSQGLPGENQPAAIAGWAAAEIARSAPTRFARTVVGGVEQALCDAAARSAGVPLWSWLTGRPGTSDDRAAATNPDNGGLATIAGTDDSELSVPVYANINRVAGGRLPEDVARAAKAAVEAGFTTIKCAPFDVPDESRSLPEAGLARLRAVRAAVGDDITLLVDCHLRLTLDEVESILPEFERLRVGWLEDAAAVEDVAGLARLRKLTDLPLAGGEFTYEPDQLRPAVEAGLVDVVMPDVKHAGGITRALSLSRVTAGTRTNVSPHNPSGPVATLASAHLFRASPNVSLLEVAVGESAGRAGTVRPPEHVAGGRLVTPYGSGLGLDLDFDTFPAARLAWSSPLRSL